MCTKTQESNYKILTRWYYTPQLLHKCFPNTSDRCWRCQEGRGTLLHIFWACPLLKQFWTIVRTFTQKFTDHQIPDDPAFFLLLDTTIPVQRYQNSKTPTECRQGLYSIIVEENHTSLCRDLAT